MYKLYCLCGKCYIIREYFMTVTGFILSGVFSHIPDSVAKQAMLCDFAEKTLNDNKIYDVKIVESGSLSDAIKNTNNNEDSRYVILSLDAAIDISEDLSSDFCVSENIRYITKTGEFLGAVLTRAADIEDVMSINKTKTLLKSEKITAQNFADISGRRKTAVASALAQDGVFIENIQTACISPLAEIGQGSFIGGQVFIDGRCRIGRNCTVSGVSRISRCDIGDNTAVLSAVMLDSKVGGSVSIGPFAYIRPNCTISNGVKVGDFVELKNSSIGSGTKISHLTYVGDSDVGYGVNFGCGTVTVNYDGIKKHRTVIGNNVFIGCNANLVAPVSVGDNAFIAAGSTITDEIPPESFAVARQRQITKEGYVRQKMPDMLKD